jgi:hypothetical protein
MPKQAAMFSTREVAQLGVRRSPMNLTTRGGKRLTMQLEIEDPRSEAEKAADRQKEAERHTINIYSALSQAETERVETLVADLKQLTEQLTELVAVAAVILQQSSETLSQLGLMTAGESAKVTEEATAKTHSSGRLHPPEELANPEPSLFGPGFHLYRSNDFWPSARAGGL